MEFMNIEARPNAKEKAQELQEKFFNKYLLMCLLAMISIAKDKNEFVLRDDNTTQRKRQRSYNHPTAEQGVEGDPPIQNPNDSTDTPQTSEPDTQNTDSIEHITFASGDTVDFSPVLPWLERQPVGQLIRRDSLVSSEQVKKNKLEEIENPVHNLAELLKIFLVDYRSKCHPVLNLQKIKLAEGFLGKIDALEPVLEAKLKTFSTSYKSEYGKLQDKMKYYIANEIKQNKMTVAGEHIEDFVFLTCFLDYLEKEGIFKKHLGYLKVDHSLEEHLERYRNQDIENNTNPDPDMERFSFFSYFFYQTWKESAKNPGQVLSPSEDEVKDIDFKKLLKKSIPLSMILNIARKYRKK